MPGCDYTLCFSKVAVSHNRVFQMPVIYVILKSHDRINKRKFVDPAVTGSYHSWELKKKKAMGSNGGLYIVCNFDNRG